MDDVDADAVDIGAVRDYFMALQDRIVERLEVLDGEVRFRREQIDNPNGGISRPRVAADGPLIEKAAVQFTHSKGDRLPPAATERNPDLAGRGFQAVAISLIVHPRNPYVPTTHANLRFFAIDDPVRPVWYFGGGWDLTPYYGFAEDCVHWHRVAAAACQPFGATVYDEMKKACDAYFQLPHRGEPRGIGGLFFDDWTRGGFRHSFDLVRSIGDRFLPAYEPIVLRRKDLPWGPREREFQCIRRGRYAEFNLAIDRGTKYGIQSGRRIESVLASLPPEVIWRYDWQPAPGSEEARLTEYFLQSRDWLGEAATAD